MKINRLHLKNIRSYEDQEIEFPEGSLLLAGDIGSGKTSILLSLEYALFGLQAGQRGAALLRNGENEGSVTLDIEIDGTSVKIERRLKRTEKGVSNESAAITIDNEKTESSITEIKTKILDLINYPTEFIKKNNLLYKYTLYTPQEQMKQIILEEKDARLNIIRHIFGVEKYKKMRENLSFLVNFIRDETKELQGEIKSLDEDKIKLNFSNSQVSDLNSRIQELLKLIKEKSSDREKIQTEIKSLEDREEKKKEIDKEITRTSTILPSKKSELSKIDLEISELSFSISNTSEFNESELMQTSRKLEDSESQISDLNKELISIESKINSLNSTLLETTGKRQRILNYDLCPTCLQNVSEVHKSNIINETESLESKTKKSLSDLQEQKSLTQKHISQIKELQKTLSLKKTELEIQKSQTSHLQNTKLKLSTLEKNRESLKKDIKILSDHLLDLKESLLEFNPLHNQFLKKESDLSKSLDEERRIDNKRAELEAEKRFREEEIANLEKIIAEKEKKKSRISEMLELNDWLNNQFSTLLDTTERNVLMKLRKQFSELFSKWFKTLVSTESLDVQLDESFTPIFIQNETEMDYNYLSGGERTAAALAYRLALNQTINSIFGQIKTKEILILDEPTDGFSEAQISKLRDVLIELNTKQLILVSHEQKIEGFVDNIIRVEKTEDTSKINLITSQSMENLTQ